MKFSSGTTGPRNNSNDLKFIKDLTNGLQQTLLTRTSRRLVTEACSLDDVSDVIVNAKESDAEVVVGSRLKTGHEVVDHSLLLNRN